MARYRKAAVAALAVTAVLAAPTAGYAHDGFHETGVTAVVAAPAPSPVWGRYSGQLTDYEGTKPDVFRGASATAMLMGVNGSTFVSLRISGIAESAIGESWGAHVHEGVCDAANVNAALGHYNADRSPERPTPLATDQNEFWLDFEVNSSGNSRSTTRVPFIPQPGMRAIVIHAEPTDPADGPAGDHLACLPLEIKAFPTAG